jgi:CheY-like chemotaxis protein
MDVKLPSRDIRIVVVDDDRDSREPYAEFLRMRGFQVDEFDSGEEALDAIAREPPEVVMMDITLAEGIDGYEAARRIRALSSSSAVRLVAMTGHSRDSVKREGSLFDAVLTKPVDPDDLVGVVERLTARPD